MAVPYFDVLRKNWTALL